MIPYFVFDKISIGPVQIYVWGLLVGLGFLAGYLLLLHLAKREKLVMEKIIGLVLVVFLGGVFGGRLFFLLQEPERFLADVSLLWDPKSGSMFWGGLLGAIFFGWLYLKIIQSFSFVKTPAGKDFWRTADLLVLPALLGIAIARLGCFLINDHQGAPTSLPWGILWPDGIARHPVALYEILLGLSLFAAFWFLRKKIHRPGDLFLYFLSAYSAGRLVLDFGRSRDGFYADPHWGALTVSQLFCLIILAASLFFLFSKKPA